MNTHNIWKRTIVYSTSNMLWTTKIEFFNDVDDRNQTLKDNELRVNIDFTYSENTFTEKGRLELNF